MKPDLTLLEAALENAKNTNETSKVRELEDDIKKARANAASKRCREKKKQKISEEKNEIERLKEENAKLKCQLEVYKSLIKEKESVQKEKIPVERVIERGLNLPFTFDPQFFLQDLEL